MTNVYYLLRSGNDEKQSEEPLNVSINGMVLLSMALLFPIGGWLADTHFGRYKTVRYSMWMMWIGAMLATFGELLAYLSVTYDTHIKKWVFLALCLVMATGLGGFQSNIVQLGIDQLIDASANEITSFILWYIMTLYASCLSLQYVSNCLANEYQMFYIKTLVVALCLTLALCSDFLCQHWLVKESRVFGKSLSDIFKVVKYVIRNRKLRYDFATEGEFSSQFNVAKHQYGGPFSAQQVEDVRTFLWMIAILAACGIVFGAITPIEYAREKVQHRWHGYNEVKGLTGCYKKLTIRYTDYIFVVTLVVLYEFFIRPLLCRWLPKGSIANKFLVGTVLFLLWILSLLAIEATAYNKQLKLKNSSVKCIFGEDYPEVEIDRKWLLIPDVMSGASCLLLVVTALEFIWAQAPSTMKGLMFGTGYAILGLNTLLQCVIAFPFLFKIRAIDWHPLTCGIWYVVMEGTIILAVLIVMSVVIKRYKKRDQSHALFDTHTSSHYLYRPLN